MAEIQPPSDGGLVIVGGSYGAVQLAASARQHGYAGQILIVSEESTPPYHKPPLSKAFLAGPKAGSTPAIRGERFYSENVIQLRLRTRVTWIDREARSVTLSDGSRLPYARLALAVGARARTLALRNACLPGVLVLRTIDDAHALRHRLQTAKSVVVVGGGFVGLETAAMSAKLGKRVTVVEALDRLLARAVPHRLASYVAEMHRTNGVELKLLTSVTDILEDNGSVCGVRCSSGETIAADLVVVGVGVVPNIEIAQDCGLLCQDGIVVDNQGRTSDPLIVAAGDCTNHPNVYADTSLRLESVQNAIDQAKVAGATVAGVVAEYSALPTFWTEQFDMNLQMAGLSRGHDLEVVRGSMAQGRFSIVYMREGRVIAADTSNDAAEHMLARKLIAARTLALPEQIADLSFDLNSLLVPERTTST